jgi:biotin carboxyl carrier protein
MSRPAIPALVAEDGPGGTVLRAPKLGLWSDHPEDGALVQPGSAVGTLVQLRRRYVLLVPEGVSGRVAIEGRPHDAVPVEYGEVLFRVTPLAGPLAAVAPAQAVSAAAAKGSHEVVAPTDGVFYRAPAIGAKPYVAVGDRLTAGQPVGLIEVMKTFNPIAYGGAGLPDDAEIVEILASDGQEVRAGQALVLVRRL